MMSLFRAFAIVALTLSVGSLAHAAGTASDPDFFWLPPTVPSAAAPTGPFDATALADLAVEICQLDPAGGACASAPLVERFTYTSTPAPSGITLDQVGEFYEVDWLTGRSHVDRDLFYRVRVLKSGAELGSVDVDFVQNTPERASVDADRYVGIVRGQQLTIRFRVQHPTARTRVRINEVESSGGVPGDWVELYNTAAVPVSLAGYIVKDNDDEHVYTLPAGTEIPARGYYVVEEAALDFGLGANDTVRFSTADDEVIVDSYSWTAHAVTTYGRCPDGIGAFQTTTVVTKGTANGCSILLRINEVESSGGMPGDWVELFNAGPTPADVTGFSFKDNDETHNFALPATVVPAGGYFVLEEAALGFGLGSADSARLYRPDGSVADSFSWTSHAATTYGRCPNGSGALVVTAAPTKGAANSCAPAITTVHINEVESSGGSPGDWIELINTGVLAADVSGWIVRDNDDTHTHVLPTGTVVPAGGYFVVEEAALGFGLGAVDSARLFDPSGTIFETFSWQVHAPTTTYGRCPNGTGAFVTTASVTKGVANDCASPVKINEVESSGGEPGDWVELHNPGATPADVSGFMFRDNDDSHNYLVPAGTVIPPGGFYLLEEAALGFGLGSGDSARIFDNTGTLLDSFTWTEHATTTYGRCPDGTGALVTTTSATKGAVNACPGAAQPWPGDGTVQTVDGVSVFGGNMSGLVYEGSGTPAPGALWAVRNGPGTLFRLIWDDVNAMWIPDPANGGSAGKALRYPDGTGNPDAEGVAFAGAGSGGGIYVATERNNDANGVSRNSILRFAPASASPVLTATHEWNLTADLPAVGPNVGMEAITWIPDTFLVSVGFVDETGGPTNPYHPANYPNHGDGLFFVGLEANGTIYAYALNHVTGGFTRVATIASGFPGVMDLHFDRELQNLWAVCDDTCQGQSAVLRPQAGQFVATQVFARPAGMPNLNNEGFAFTPLIECVGDLRPAFWSDDTETDGHAIRRGALTCAPF